MNVALIAGVLQRHGRIDALVHSAGLVLRAPLEEMRTETWRRLLSVNLVQHFFFIQTQDIREDWTDGTYMIAEAVAPVSINAPASGTFTFSGAEQFRGTLYSPTAQSLGNLNIFSEFHATFVDGVPVSNASQFRILGSPC